MGYQSRNYAWIRGLNDVELDPVDCSSTPNCVNLLAQARAYEGLCVGTTLLHGVESATILDLSQTL